MSRFLSLILSNLCPSFCLTLCLPFSPFFGLDEQKQKIPWLQAMGSDGVVLIEVPIGPGLGPP